MPWGTVGAIGVWNYPMQTASWKIAPALMCGNAVIYKPSPFAPVTSVLLAQILQAAGLPDSVLSVLQVHFCMFWKNFKHFCMKKNFFEVFAIVII